MHRKRRLKYIVEQWFYFAWSNLIDGEHVPQAPLRSEKPPGSYIWKASVYFQNANAAHLKGYKLQRTHKVNVLECSAGGLRPHLCQVQVLPPPRLPSPSRTPAATHKHASLKRKTAATERLSQHQNHVYPFYSFIYKGLMEDIYTRCAGDWDAPCARWGQPLGEPGETMPDLLPPALLSPAPFGTLPCPPVRASEEGEGGWEG